jgi:hypothetical protein
MVETATSFIASNWQPIQGHSVFRGIFSVRMPGALIIHGVSLFEKAGARWVSLPKRRHCDENGDFVWIPVVELDDPPTLTWQILIGKTESSLR